MKAIFKYDNVYVTAPSKDIRQDVNVEEIRELVYCYVVKRDFVNLYGGRIYLRSYDTDNLIMTVDGITIKEISFSSSGECKTTSEMSLHKATAFLNQIENLGVDTFIENYRIQLQALKTEIEGSVIKLEQELSVQQDEDKNTVLKNLRASLRMLSCMIFMLLINLNAGLDNHCYSEVYENITNLYF